MEEKKTDNWNHWWRKTRSSRWGKKYFTVGDVKQIFNIWQNQKKYLSLQVETLKEENKKLKNENKQLNEFIEEINITNYEY